MSKKYRVGVLTDVGDCFFDHVDDWRKLLQNELIKFEINTNMIDLGYLARRCDIIIIDGGSIGMFAGNLRDLANDVPSKEFYLTGGLSKRYMSEEFGDYIKDCPNIHIVDLSLIVHKIRQFYCEEE